MNIKSTLPTITKTLLATTILGCIFTATRKYKLELSSLPSIDWRLIIIGLTVTLVYRITNAHGWNLSLQTLGHSQSSRDTLRIWLTSEACRWLPGSVWGYGSRAYQANKAGVPLFVATGSLVVEIGLTVLAWVSIAAIGFVACRDAFLQVVNWEVVWGVVVAGSALGVVGGVVCCVNRSSNGWLATRLGRITEPLKSLQKAKLDFGKAFMTWGYYVLMCALNGVAFNIVLHAVTSSHDIPWLVVIAANAMAWLVGFFAVFAPGGLVVREGTLALILAPWLPAEHAIAAALVWRLVQIAAELACVVPAMLSQRVDASIDRRIVDNC